MLTIGFLVCSISVWIGRKHAGNGGGIRLRFHEEPQAAQCPVFLQRNEGGRAL